MSQVTPQSSSMKGKTLALFLCRSKCWPTSLASIESVLTSTLRTGEVTGKGFPGGEFTLISLTTSPSCFSFFHNIFNVFDFYIPFI